MMRDYLKNKGFTYSILTIHQYMKELGLRSIIRRKAPDYLTGPANKIFPNLLNRKFDVSEADKYWCTDFTYLPQEDGTMRYNCTIIDLYRRVAIATLNGPHIDWKLAADTLAIALKKRNYPVGVILHSDQGVQFTCKNFNDYCRKNNVQQSMSRAGCPYDNAPMERFYNTLKNEYFNIHTFRSTAHLDQGIYNFIKIKYNYSRPHSHNGGQPPYVAS